MSEIVLTISSETAKETSRRTSKAHYWRHRSEFKERYASCPEIYASRMLVASYGITLDDYDRLLDAQGGGCAICGSPRTNRRLAVDHDHTTGTVRGILCSHCNTGLGGFKDDPVRLAAAIDYLKGNTQ